MNPTALHTIVIGAGLAGLAAAHELHRAGKRFLLLEASNRVGGRLRTDREAGYCFDHGFQVLLTEYSECKRRLDYARLGLGEFEPGALVWTGKRFEIIADPLRQPNLLWPSLTSSIGMLSDKIRILKMKRRLNATSEADIYHSAEEPSIERLKRLGFSDSLIEGFFRPFFGAVFLESDLATSSRTLDFVFKCFSQGRAALPSGGMHAIPAQIASSLPQQSIRVDSPVAEASAKSATLESGQVLRAEHVLLATDMDNAARLAKSASLARAWNGTRCHYFSATQSPLARKMIALNASGRGAIQTLCVPSDIAPSYAPSGRTLICVTTPLQAEANAASVAEDLKAWFPRQAEKFTHLRSYAVPHSLPHQLPGDSPRTDFDPRGPEGVWICGDYRHSSSIQGALASGRLAAEAILAG